MRAADIMTRDVATATPDASIHDIASLMVAHRIGCVPILHGAALVGIITESDLLRRAELGGAPVHSRLADLFASVSSRAADYIRAHSRRAADVMTRKVVVAGEAMELGELAGILEARGLKRLPVLDAGGKLVGIVGRANLVQALARHHAPVAVGDDAVIRDRLLAELRGQSWAGGLDPAQVIVEDGVVHLWGRIAEPAVRQAMVVAAENTPGVKAVEDHLAESMAYDPMDRPHWNDAPP